MALKPVRDLSWMTRMRRRRSLACDERGAPLLEFALIALPFFGLLVAILQTSLTFFAQQTLETTAEKAVRPLITGVAQKAGVNQSQFKTSVCQKLPTFMKCSRTSVSVQTVDAFSNASTGPTTVTYDASGNAQDGSWAPGQPGKITVVKILYVWDVQSGPLGFDLSTMSGSKRLLVATSVFKTEQYKA